ncbi:hypothetical protein [Mucilaginibacter sp.]|uniref:hypothetical protein n=1 Tax=Mucilaginibacter sp. TaxID=1882438 RepID=UPI00261E84C4|nr:hypothetical protein [Mucilaginibacter sp.]
MSALKNKQHTNNIKSAEMLLCAQGLSRTNPSNGIALLSTLKNKQPRKNHGLEYFCRDTLSVSDLLWKNFLCPLPALKAISVDRFLPKLIC